MSYIITLFYYDMKNLSLKGIALAIVLSLGTTNVMAQGFLNKINKGLDKVNSVLGDSDKEEGKTGDTTTGTTPADTITMAGFEADFPSFTVKPTIMIDSEGDTIRNEDGTPQLNYLIYDQNDKLCRKDTAEVMIKIRKKAALIIAAKIAGGAAGGAAVGSGIGKLTKGKKGAKKGAIWGSLAGAAVGTALSAGDMKKIREKNKILKNLEEELDKYGKTFTEKGIPRDKEADLSEYNGVEPVVKYLADMEKELDEPRTNIDLKSLEDIQIDESILNEVKS